MVLRFQGLLNIYCFNFCMVLFIFLLARTLSVSRTKEAGALADMEETWELSFVVSLCPTPPWPPAPPSFFGDFPLVLN